MPRVTRQQATGTAGEAGVEADFLAIRWQPTRIAAIDVGTDLWVEAADEQGTLLGCVVGVQVKTGTSHFRRRVEVDGERGWWYYEPNAEHFDHWAGHNAPHLIVLRDEVKKVSYWEHVTPEAVEDTGKGRKIFVPASQTIDQEHAADLRAVARPRKSAPWFEGTALGPAGAEVPQGRELCYALIAPRLVAPYTNYVTNGPITAVQGAALLAQGRFRALKHQADRHPGVPDPENPGVACDWTWRFVAAIWAWATTDSVGELESVFETAPNPPAEAACGVFLACALARCERHHDAITLLTALAEHTCASPIDQGWTLAQRARARVESGDREAGREDAEAALRLLHSHPGDITANAIAAGAQWVVAITTPPKDRVSLAALASSDTNVSWWRTQLAAGGLAKSVDVSFQNWSQELTRVLIGRPDHGSAELFGAELCADLSGEHLSWTWLASRSARLRIQNAAESHNETSETAEGLNSLRLSGDHQAFKLAMDRLLLHGPLEAAAKAVNQIRPTGWTRTAIAANFAALSSAGTLLHEQMAAEMVDAIAHLAGDRLADFLDRYQPTVHVEFAVLEALAGLMPATALSSHNTVAALIARQRRDLPDVMARYCASMLAWLDSDSVDDTNRDALTEIAFGPKTPLSTYILGWLATNDDAKSLKRLRREAARGDLASLAELPDVPLLTGAEAASLTTELEQQAQILLADMRSGTYTSDGASVFGTLALLNLTFSDSARWSTIHHLLRAPFAQADQKNTVCMLIAEHAGQIPDSEKEEIVSNIDSVATAEEGFWPGETTAGTDVVLAIALDGISPDDADERVTRLALGSEQGRNNAATLLGLGHCPKLRPMLALLVQDPQAPVRLAAARSTGKLAAYTDDPLTADLAHHVADAAGQRLPLKLIWGLAEGSGPVNDTSRQIANHLSDHISARVRRQAQRLLQRPT